VKVVGYTLFQNSSGMAHSRDDRRERQRKESSFHFKGNTVAEKNPTLVNYINETVGEQFHKVQRKIYKDINSRVSKKAKKKVKTMQ